MLGGRAYEELMLSRSTFGRLRLRLLISLIYHIFVALSCTGNPATLKRWEGTLYSILGRWIISSTLWAS